MLLLCLRLYCHGYQERSKNRVRFSDKLYWVHIPDHHYLLIVSSHHTWLQLVVDVHRRRTSAPAPSLLYIWCHTEVNVTSSLWHQCNRSILIWAWASDFGVYCVFVCCSSCTVSCPHIDTLITAELHNLANSLGACCQWSFNSSQCTHYLYQVSEWLIQTVCV